MQVSSFQDLNQLSAYFHKLDSNSVEDSEENPGLETENYVVHSEGFLDSLRDLEFYGSNITNNPDIDRKKKRVFSITTDTICSIPSTQNSPHPLKLTLKYQSISETQGQPDPQSPTDAKSTPEHNLHDIDVLCVNCYECIPMDAVDLHSDACCRNISILSEIEDDTDLRIRKLQAAMKDRQNLVDSDHLEILIKLQEISYVLLENSLSINLIMSSIEAAVTECLALPNSYGCIIFARRLAILADLKRSDLPKDISFLDDDKLKAYEDELTCQKQELARWKMRNEFLLQLTGITSPQPLLDVASDLDDSDCSIVSYTSIQSELTGPQLTEVIFTQCITENFEEIPDEDQEKLFYSILLKKKFSLPRDHRGRNVSIKEVYDIVNRENIPVIYWDYFLDDLLMNV